MSISQLITDGKISFDGYNDTQVQELTAALERLYTVGAAKTIFDELDDDIVVLQFVYKNGAAQAVPGSYLVELDPNYAFKYIAPNGNIVDASLARIAMHEIFHAVKSERDPLNSLVGDVPNPDYAGGAVRLTDPIMMQLGEEARQTYANVGATLDSHISDWVPGTGSVQTIIVTTSYTVSPFNGVTTSPGPEPDTHRNKTLTNDLIIDAASTIMRKESFYTGLGCLTSAPMGPNSLIC